MRPREGNCARWGECGSCEVQWLVGALVERDFEDAEFGGGVGACVLWCDFVETGHEFRDNDGGLFGVGALSSSPGSSRCFLSTVFLQDSVMALKKIRWARSRAPICRRS